VEAQAKVAEAASARRLQPTFTASTSGNYGRVAEPSSIQTFGTAEGQVTLPVPNGGRAAASRAQAEAQLRAAQAGMARTRLDLFFRANDAYYGVLRARDAREIAATNLEQAERQMHDTQIRIDAGDLPPSEILKTQVPVAQARAALDRASIAVRVAEQTLNSLLSRDLAAPVVLRPAAELPALNLTREQAADEALRSSPDVVEAQAEFAAAQAAVNLTRRAHDPEWSLQAIYLTTGDITAYANLATLTLNVTLPLNDGGAGREQLKQSVAQREQARAALRQAQTEARLAAEAAFLDVEGDRANVAATRETLRIAEESVGKARQAYNAGLTTTRDVLDALHDLAQARSDANSAVYDLAVARARLDQAIGRPPAPDMPKGPSR
jgi:outer membrane protein TolC